VSGDVGPSYVGFVYPESIGVAVGILLLGGVELKVPLGGGHLPLPPLFTANVILIPFTGRRLKLDCSD